MQNSTPDQSKPQNRKVALAGATGLVGGYLLQGLLADDSIAEIHVLSRRTLNIRHPKLAVHVVDFKAIPPLPLLDEVYLALGTTIKVAGSQAAFRAVDFDANLAVALAARQSGASRLGLVSAMGADAHSRTFYSRVKGELEDALIKAEFGTLVIARPSLLLGNRASLAQPPRLAEKIAMAAGKFLGPFLPADYRPVEAASVASALLDYTPTTEGLKILTSGVLQAS
ncbi:MAG: NAD(P)H-binding protein [Iodobacter sp.]